MQRKINWYRTFQALSLDVVIGAIVFSLAIGRYYNVQIPLKVLVCLSIAIWLIYTFDHILDARRINHSASTYRHQFHKKYQNSLIVFSSFLLIIGIINAFYLPASIFYSGLAAMFFSSVYFWVLQKETLWAKEICVALIYTIGIFLAPVGFSFDNTHSTQFLLIPQVFLLVLSNLLIFSWFDISKDKKDGHSSTIIHFGIKKSEAIIKTVLITGLVVSLITFLSGFTESVFIMQIIILLMFTVLILIFKYDSRFRQNDFYRAIGDGIFFIPILYLVYAEIRQL